MREFKAVVLGGAWTRISQYHCANPPHVAGGVGKSALAVRFVRDEFVEVYDPTIEGTGPLSGSDIRVLTQVHTHRGVPAVLRG